MADRDIHLDKHRMSGFWDTALDSVLRNLGVRHLFLCGVNVDQCVYATLIDAACAGYDCLLITDASATTSPDNWPRPPSTTCASASASPAISQRS